MATLIKGTTFTSGQTVTPDNLNNLVDAATVTYTSAGDTDNSTLEVNSNKLRVKDLGITVAKLATTTQQALLPAGAVMPFAINSAPSGWLAADGTAVSRSTYATLFAAISTAHGAGDGSTTFNLPDLRGIFVRGSGSQAISGITYNKTFAAKEGDAMQGHLHGPPSGSTSFIADGGAGLGGGGSSRNATNTGGPVTDGTNGTPRTATETRPANIALLYCIKF
jgi:hypothetical protein